MAEGSLVADTLSIALVEDHHPKSKHCSIFNMALAVLVTTSEQPGTSFPTILLLISFLILSTHTNLGCNKPVGAGQIEFLFI